MLRPLSIAAALALPALAHSAEPPSELEPKDPTPTVEVSGSRSSGERQTETTTKIIIGQDELLRHGDQSLADALKRLPGVTVGGPGDLRMRGLGAGYTQVLVNGETTAPGFAIDSIPPELIERIEILRSASAEFSTQAIAGTINVILRKSARRADRQLKFGVGRNQERWSPSATLQWSDRAGALSYSIASSLSRQGTHADPLVTEIERNSAGDATASRVFDQENWGQYTSASVVPRLNWTFENGDTLTSQSYLEYARPTNFATESESTLLGSSTAYPHNHWESRAHAPSARTTLSWEHRVRERDKLIVNFGVDYFRRSTDYTFYGLNGNDDLLLTRIVDSSSRDMSYKASGKYLTHLFQTGSLAMGWDTAYTERSERRLQIDSTSYVLDENFAADINRLAFFIQDEMELTSRLQLYAGVRWEGLETVTDGRTLEPVRNRSSVWSPILQTLWKPPYSERDQVRLALSRTYKPPRARELVPRRFTTNNNNSPTEPDTQGNPNLRPELAWGLDVAYETYFRGNGLASLSLFARKIDDVTITRLYEENGVWILTPVNGGKANVHGFETEAKFPLARGLDIRLNFARNWSRLNSLPKPYNRLSEQKPLSANFGFDYALTSSLTFGSNYNFQGGGPTRLTQTLGSYNSAKEVVDVYGLWKTGGQTQVRVSFSNVLNQDSQVGRFFEDEAESLVRRSTTPTTTGVRLVVERKF